MEQRIRNADRGAATVSVGRRYLRHFVYAREYLALAGLFIVVITGLSLVTYVGVEILASVRAYTNAEALYSKAQKDAVYYLHQYALSHHDEHFDKYSKAIAIPLGYRQARNELEKSEPNLDIIRAGLIQGQSHPDDGAGPIWLFHMLRRVDPARRALRLWSEADLLIGQLQNIAVLIRQEVNADVPDTPHIAVLLQEMERLNVNLTTLETAFSSTLGEGARSVRRVVLVSVGLAALLLLLLGLVPSSRMLKRIKDSEVKFRRLFEQSRDAIVLVTLEGSIGYANPAAYELFGYPIEAYAHKECQAMPATDYFAELRALEALKQALAQDGFLKDYEVQLSRIDGRIIDCLVSATLIRDRLGRPVGYETILRDITERKLTDRRMRLLERAVEASGNVILITDATQDDFPIVYVNPAFERVTGYAKEEAIGRNGFFLLGDEEEAEYKLNCVQHALKMGEEGRTVLRNNRRDGRVLWHEISFAPVCDADGEPIYYVGIQTDVTERKEAEETLTKALEKEKELHELKSRFVAMASHEFRTPLATILSSSELIERFGKDWDEARTTKHLRRIQSGVHSLTNLLENVLVMGKVEAERLTFKAEPVELRTFTEELVEEVWLAQGEDRLLDVEVAPDSLRTQADPSLLRYVLSNLLTNAAKYSPTDQAVRFKLERRNGHAIFQVQDKGIGIPEEELPRIFEPFHRASNVETVPGTGLGLAIAKNAVELHGGTIKVESKEGQGTTVTVLIPLAMKGRVAAAKV